MTAPAIKRGGRPKGYPKSGGRKKGTPNRINAVIKDAVIEAAMRAGGTGGVVGYLTTQATANPNAFLALLGRIIPTQIEGTSDGGAITVRWLPPDA